jgi:hypothetical protein
MLFWYTNYDSINAKYKIEILQEYKGFHSIYDITCVVIYIGIIMTVIMSCQGNMNRRPSNIVLFLSFWYAK